MAIGSPSFVTSPTCGGRDAVKAVVTRAGLQFCLCGRLFWDQAVALAARGGLAAQVQSEKVQLLVICSARTLATMSCAVRVSMRPLAGAVNWATQCGTLVWRARREHILESRRCMH